MTVRVLTGDCREVLATLPEASVDSVVTDPPYGWTFMGRKWDYDVPSVELWAGVLRVLKPGGHLLCFCGTRTQHRMAVNIEDAGFEIRDMLAWVYGSGFPKSLDVSKAIDKAAGAEREVVGVKPGHENFVGRNNHPLSGGWDRPWASDPEAVTRYHMATAPATDAARQWQGWGTALKPSTEPVTWATKPFNPVPPDVMIETEQLIGMLICLSLSPAKHAELYSALSRNELDGASGSARLIAAVHHGLNSGGLLAKTDMFRSPAVAKTIWSTVASWSAILEGVSLHQNTFTTSTALSLTTGLRTFNSLVSATMRESTDRDATQTSGSLLSAPIVGESSSDTRDTCKGETFARELATWLQGQRLASNAEESFASAARIASSVLSDAITNLGESIRPSLEPITLARKPLAEKTVAGQVLATGTGALNVDGCRVPMGDGPKGVWGAKQAASIGFHGGTEGSGFATQENPSGRWPANLLHDGSEEAVGLFPVTKARGNRDKSGARGAMKEDVYAGGWGAKACGAECNYDEVGSQGSAARFFYCAKASKRDRGEGNVHPTVKPTDLMRWLVRLVTPPGGTVLDPFAGSGTTGLAAAREGFNATLIEMDPAYAEMARNRLLGDGGMFAEVAAE